jgi:hypothetical protein
MTQLTVQQIDEYAVLAATADHIGDKVDPKAVLALVAEIGRLQAQRKYLITQLAKQNAESGRGNTALNGFLAAEPDDCPGFEGNPVAPDLCAGCGQSRRWHDDTPARP